VAHGDVAGRARGDGQEEEREQLQRGTRVFVLTADISRSSKSWSRKAAASSKSRFSAASFIRASSSSASTGTSLADRGLPGSRRKERPWRLAAFWNSSSSATAFTMVLGLIPCSRL